MAMPTEKVAEVMLAQTLSVASTPGTVIERDTPEFAGTLPPPGTVTLTTNPVARADMFDPPMIQAPKLQRPSPQRPTSPPPLENAFAVAGAPEPGENPPAPPAAKQANPNPADHPKGMAARADPPLEGGGPRGEQPQLMVTGPPLERPGGSSAIAPA